mgnify:CR=1 FL=1
MQRLAATSCESKCGGEEEDCNDFHIVFVCIKFPAPRNGDAELEFDPRAKSADGNVFGLNAWKISADLYAIIGVYDADLPDVQTEDVTIGGFGALVRF